MYKNATVEIYKPTTIKNSQGDKISTWGYLTDPITPPVETFRADVQPKALTDAERMLYGLSDGKADTRIIFFERAVNVQIGNRVRVTSDFPNSTPKYFDLGVPVFWPRHGECLLIPVVGE